MVQLDTHTRIAVQWLRTGGQHTGCQGGMSQLPQYLPKQHQRGALLSHRMLSIEPKEYSQRTFALAFDGLFCDSARAWATIGWKAALSLWPDLGPSVSTISPRDAGVRRAWLLQEQSIDELGNLDEEGMPDWLALKVEKLRPAVQSEYESLLLVRLCVDEALASQRSKRGMRPLTAGEVYSSWSQLRESLLFRCSVDKQTLAHAYEEASEQWANADSDGWHGAHSMRPGAVRALRSAMRNSNNRVYLLTSRRDRALRLTRSAQVLVPKDQVLECGSVSATADALHVLLLQHHAAEMHFVDSHAETVRTMAADLRLLPYKLHYAQWGYSTPSHGALASTMPRVNLLPNSESLRSLLLR